VIPVNGLIGLFVLNGMKNQTGLLVNPVLNPEKNQNPKTAVLGKIGIVKEFTNKDNKGEQMGNSVVNIKGKNYRLVSDRVKQFRQDYSGHRLQTEMLHFDGSHLILKVSVLDSKGNVIADGIAAEKVGSSNINQTSFAENCQTSAVGRALAFLDEKLMGDSLPSADEMTGAINQQTIQKVKVDAICDVLRVCKTEEQLKDIWDAQSSLWKKDFGDFGFKVIEEHKNRFKKELSKQVA
jgi:hypothetical protein|tara:strand:- start:167 stop:877 length:711 start_codon:yes stop_codon:yes gene_type:complete